MLSIGYMITFSFLCPYKFPLAVFTYKEQLQNNIFIMSKGEMIKLVFWVFFKD